MKCKYCEHVFNDDFSFCPYCGGSNSKGESDDFMNYTLKQVYDLWADEHFVQIGEKGIESYHTAWNRLQVIKDMKMTSIKTRHYQQIVTAAIKEGLSRSSLEKIKQLASQLSKFAMRNDMIDKNYGALITLPRAVKSSRDRFTDKELEILWQNKSDPTVQIMLVLAYTGLRINELFTLKKANVHLEDDIPFFVCGSKTDAGRDRTVIISDLILDLVKSAYTNDGDYLFSNQAGNSIDPCCWRRRKYYPTLERLGIQKREVHCLRHTFASMMVKSGADLKSIAQMMGHSRFTTTLEIYTHADIPQLADAIQKLSHKWSTFT